MGSMSTFLGVFFTLLPKHGAVETFNTTHDASAGGAWIKPTAATRTHREWGSLSPRSSEGHTREDTPAVLLKVVQTPSMGLGEEWVGSAKHMIML